MTCGNKGCKIKAKINPRSGLCPGCDDFVQGVNRRMDGLDRRQQARDQSHAANRDLVEDTEQQGQDKRPGVNQPGNASNVFDFPPNNAQSQVPLPNVDLKEIIQSCENAKNGAPVDSGKVLGDMLGMIVHMYAKQSENNATKEQVHSNTDRISQLESKVGDPNDVAYNRSIAIRKLPLPPHGVSELQNAQHYLDQIKAPGVNVNQDCVKAIRKEAMKHNPNLGPNLGTVLIELRNDEVRGNIMKSKKNLMNHPALVMQNLIIKNALSPTEMKAQNTNLGMLKMITGNNDFFIAGNGMIRKKDQNFQQHNYQNQQNTTNQDPKNQSQQNHQIPQKLNQAQHIHHEENQNQNALPNNNRNQQIPQFQNAFQAQNNKTRMNFNFQQPQEQPFQKPQHPNYSQMNFQYRLPTFNTNINPNFPPYQFSAQLPHPNPAQVPAAHKAMDSSANLLDFDFGPSRSQDEQRPGSAHSARSLSPTAGTSNTDQSHGASQMQ